MTITAHLCIVRRKNWPFVSLEKKLTTSALEIGAYECALRPKCEGAIGIDCSRHITLSKPIVLSRPVNGRVLLDMSVGNSL